MSIKSIVSLIFTVLCITISNAQTLNNYKYVIVPEQFEFQRSPHDYDVNKMIQFTFNKYDFIAFLASEVPKSDLSICDALMASIKSTGFIKTTFVLTLKDCKGNIVYTSPKGTSIKKDYRVAYYEAVRDVFKAPQLRQHKYFPLKKPKVGAPKQSLPAVITKPRPIKPIKEGPKALTGKRVTKTPAKASGPSLLFALRAKQYAFIPQGRNYAIHQAGKPIGQATFNPESNNYNLKAGTLSGTGVFDDYGNFELNRVNPVTQKPIKDVLARVE